MDLVQIKRVAIGAAFKGAEIIRKFYGNLSKVDRKGAIDLVTEKEILATNGIIHREMLDILEPKVIG